MTVPLAFRAMSCAEQVELRHCHSRQLLDLGPLDTEPPICIDSVDHYKSMIR